MSTGSGMRKLNDTDLARGPDEVFSIISKIGRGFARLSDESLTRPPEEVFDILGKLGEGSYGSVYKALHKESGQVLAIKQVPVDTDLQEIIKEISIMQQCDSPHIVKYYGSYFKNTDLWIVMEYCGAGSVSDIMRLRNKTLTEDEIATTLYYTLMGLEYLHERRKIHRDIKAGNILLNTEGHAKLADFGVAGQLTDTMAKRNTVIGTPYWMAPEVIQEIGYNCVADIWSLGITALELAEGKPPYGDIHPMRAIFMIPTKPPPSFRDPDRWSPEFIDFVSQCLVKNPEQRTSAKDLLQHEFILNAQSTDILHRMIAEAKEILEEQSSHASQSTEDNDEAIGKTMVKGEEGTLLPGQTNEGTLQLDDGTMIINSSSTLDSSDLGTMIINDTDEEDSTMKKYDTDTDGKYRPVYLDHFEAKAKVDKTPSSSQPGSAQSSALSTAPVAPASAHSPLLQQQPQSPIPAFGLGMGMAAFGKSFENDFDFLQNLSYEEIQSRLQSLDPEMDREIEELHKRYQAKRQPILDAIDVKKKRQPNF